MTNTQITKRTVADTQGVPALFISGDSRYYRVDRTVEDEGHAYAINVDTGEYMFNPDLIIDTVIRE